MPSTPVVLFDLDDTLVDHSSAMRKGAAALAAVAAPAVDCEAFAEHWKNVHAALYPCYLRGEIRYEEMRRRRVRETIDPLLSPEAADQLFDVYMRAYETAWRAFDDVVPTLIALSGCRLGVVTNGRSAEQRRKLVACRLDSYFEHVAISEEVGLAKPDAGIFLGACTAMGVAPHEAVFVGDDLEVDFRGARNAGLRAVRMNRRDKEDHEASETTITTLLQLPNLLAKLR